MFFLHDFHKPSNLKRVEKVLKLFFVRSLVLYITQAYQLAFNNSIRTNSLRLKHAKTIDPDINVKKMLIALLAGPKDANQSIKISNQPPVI